MKATIKPALTILGAALLLSGCISHHSTVYRDEGRIPVRFENDKAAHIFYEALSKYDPYRSKEESETEVSLPIIFSHERRVVTGANVKFNDAVKKCDTDQDGAITEDEAKIFSENVVK
ncbi:MAG: hypothetical protein K9N48_02570 [Verrucomicrobia bacterium]|nr:hypothetical protein [Verrucomicrobiota bacterium]MCF7708960.1 hypothetical protein [Verrucomicrobiota bacterium]